MTSMAKNPGNVAGGHKATLANINVSQEAKEHSKQVLEGMERDGELPEQNKPDMEGKNPNNVIGGHKATLKNPNVSEGAKDRSKDVLQDMGVDA